MLKWLIKDQGVRGNPLKNVRDQYCDVVNTVKEFAFNKT